MSIEWTPERTETLTGLWKEGLSTAEIGRRLGVTKNAVVGKVHRLGLPKRQSPIAAKTAPAATAAPAKPAVPKPAGPKPQVHKAEVVRLEGLRPGMCSWPIGEPGTESFHFCGGTAVPGKPYCAEHCAKAYVKSSKDSRSESKQSAA